MLSSARWNNRSRMGHSVLKSANTMTDESIVLVLNKCYAELLVGQSWCGCWLIEQPTTPSRIVADYKAHLALRSEAILEPQPPFSQCALHVLNSGALLQNNKSVETYSCTRPIQKPSLRSERKVPIDIMSTGTEQQLPPRRGSMR